MHSHIHMLRSNDLEHCVNCHKQGKDYTTVYVDVFRMSFCEDCFEKFLTMLRTFNRKGKFNERN